MKVEQKAIGSIAVLGGTFDPIHNGHLALAAEVCNRLPIDEMLLIPAYVQPFKTGNKITFSDLRMKMVELAIEDDPRFSVSSMEIDRGKVSYTYDTILQLKERYGDETQIFFITGADAFMMLDHWRNADWLLKHCGFIAASRPGYDLEKLEKKAQELRDRFSGSQIHVMEINTPDISSTMIRERSREGKSLEGLVPEKVEELIRSLDLYR